MAKSTPILQRRIIRILDDAVKSRIAAGEVVERPASVVKELVENALDAGASQIHIDLEDGGRTLIRVRDDGVGMNPEDLRLSIQRHATSKLKEADELFGLDTLGFRGEALPSIGSVARLQLTSRTRETDHAWTLLVEGGIEKEVQPASSAIGTSIEVRDLFYNLPARQRFLKGPGPEASACAEMITRLALLRPDVGFFLKQGRQEILSCPAWKPVLHEQAELSNPTNPVHPEGWAGPAHLPLDAYHLRARQALGSSVKDLTPFEFTLPITIPDQISPSGTPPKIARLFGLLCPPAQARPNRSSIYLSVNARPVKDRTFTTALQEAYRQLLPPKRFPAAVLFLELPGSEVDINVHPAKAEVRFRNANFLFSLLHQAVRSTFGVESRENPPASENVEIPRAPVPLTLSRFPQMDLWKTSSNAVPAEPVPVEPAAPIFETLPVPSKTAAESSRVEEAPAPFGPVIQPSASIPRTIPVPTANPAPVRNAAVQAAVPVPAAPPEYRILGQAAGSYLVIEDAEGVKLIDQHALHERILFEALLEKSRTGSSQGSQRLLVPDQIELTPAQAGAWSDPAVRGVLAELGFELEDFGPRTLALRAQPLALRGHKAVQLVVQLLESLGKGTDALIEGLPKASFATLREKAIYIISCKSAIKAGEALNTPQMEALLSEFFRLTGQQPLPPGAKSISRFTCPHGRPLAVEINWDEIERRVGR